MSKANKNYSNQLKFNLDKGTHYAIVAFIVVLSVFLFAANSENQRSIEVQRNDVFDALSILQTKVDSLLNQRIRSTQGVIAYIMINPDLTSEEFTNYSTNIIDIDDKIIRNVSVLKDTTITFVYPYEGNESAIGVNLGEIEGQKETIFKVRDSKLTLLTPPIDLVQGGRGIIVRMPVYLPESSGGQYWGQVSLVVNYDELLDQTGLNEFAEKYNIKIEQLDSNDVYQHTMFSNYENFSNRSAVLTVALPYAKWKITGELKDSSFDKTDLYYIILVLGLIFAITISIFIRRIFQTNQNLNDLVDERTRKLYDTNEYLEQSMGELEEKQAELTELNEVLQVSLEDLKDTQNQLIMNEKLASLGELVASVAHEINTPLGICITLATFLKENEEQLKNKIELNKLSKNDLVNINSENIDAAEVMFQNLQRASDLVSSFKMVAVDQHLDEYRMIDLNKYIHDVLKSLYPKIKKTTHELTVDVPEDISVYTYPGALSQIITNMIMNSLLHGFEVKENGKMHISVSVNEVDDVIVFEYTDDGKGIPEDNISRVFTPFFTTRKNKGSTGLGLHIVYNLTIQMLNGSIELDSKEGKGVKFTIEFPYVKSIEE